MCLVSTQFYPLDQSLLQHAAVAIVNDYQQSVIVRVDTGEQYAATQQIVFVPHAGHARELFQRCLGINPDLSFFNVSVTTPTQWLQQHCASESICEENILNQQQEHLALAVLLQDYPTLYGTGSVWQLAEDLLSLFQQLAHRFITLPDSEEALVAILKDAYGLEHPALHKEASLVYQLWSVWHDNLTTESTVSHANHLLKQVQASLNKLQNSHASYQFYIVGVGLHNDLEKYLCEQLATLPNTQMQHFWHSQDPTTWAECTASDLRTQWLDTCFDQQQNLLTRIDICRSLGDPIQQQHLMVTTQSEEAEARATLAAIIEGLNSQPYSVDVILEDRKLARRLRALLERHQLQFRDNSGWAFSTTQIAAVIEAWMQCIEEDFPYQALFTVLRSQWILPYEDRDIYQADDPEMYRYLVYRFEQDVVLHENISSGLHRFQRALKYRADRLQWTSQVTQQLHYLLNLLQTAANQVDYKNTYAVHDWVAQLIASFKQLDIIDQLQNDLAGQQLMEVLYRLRNTSTAFSSEHALSWIEFRTWFNRLLEQTPFEAEQQHSRINLLTLEQSYLRTMSFCVIAGIDEKRFPRTAQRSYFFNDAVNTALGLRTVEETQQQAQQTIKHVLHHAKQLRLIMLQGNHEEMLSASPLLEWYKRFYEQCYNQPFCHEWHDDELQPEQPKQLTLQPKPMVQASHLPASLTVSAHQRLINCPYHFYLSDILGLKPNEKIKEKLSRGDYGNRVHRCLEIFHSGQPAIDKLGAFTQPLDAAHRQAAIEHLQAIAEQEFSRDIRESFEHVNWLQRWQSMIPEYIDWAIKQADQWQIELSETTLTSQAIAGISLQGRIDRGDINQGNERVLIDYKTGSNIAGIADIGSGEDVQLASYALLLENVSRVIYLQLDKQVKSIEPKGDLEQLKQQLHDRLETVITMIKKGHELPAQPYTRHCQYCPHTGICRQKSWG